MMNINSLVTAQPSSQEVAGTWYAIQWSPDPRTGERYNIGVAVIEENGRHGVKLLDSFSRLECIYGKESAVAFHAELACSVIEHYLEEMPSDIVASLSGFPQISMKERGVVKGVSLSEAASRLYYEMVPLGREVLKRKGFSPVSRSQLTRGIRSILRPRFRKISTIMPPKAYYKADGVSKKLYLPVRNTRLVATFASARVATYQTAKLNIYEAQQDISIAARIGISQRNYFHLLLPDDNAGKKQVVEIENQIDSVEFMLKKVGVTLMTHNDEQEMAEAVFEEYNEAA